MNAHRVPLDDLGVFAMMATALAMPPVARDPLACGGLTEAGKTTGTSAPRRGLLDRLDHWFWKREQRALEARLGAAKDVYDLEARIRDLERGVLYRYC